jgi:acid stress chaperone HdeB
MLKIRSYIFPLLTIISSALSCQIAVAETIDLKTLSCQDLLQIAEENTDDAVFISVWLDGYLSGVTGDTKLSEDGFGMFVEKLQRACERSPSSLVLNVSKIVGIK